MKFLLLLLVVIVVLAWLARLKKSQFHRGSSKARHDHATRDNGDAERMVRCAHCGTYIPASEAVNDASGIVFCSAEHLRLGKIRS